MDPFKFGPNKDLLKDEPWIDRLCKSLGTRVSRRTAFKIGTGIIGGLTLSGLDYSYSKPSTAYAATLCPYRVPNGVPPSHNGCGTGWNQTSIPDHYKKASFVQACDNHDDCYSTCNRNKSTCDDQLYVDLIAACTAAYSNPKQDKQYSECAAAAAAYANDVRNAGLDAYASAQQVVCTCCSASPCGNICACETGQTCCQNTCINLSTDPNNCGSCGHACSAGQLCVNGNCTTPCNSPSSSCSTDLNCCANEICQNGKCCLLPGIVSAPVCQQNSDCCSGVCCTKPGTSYKVCCPFGFGCCPNGGCATGC